MNKKELNLNDRQKEAVFHNEGALLILAGPGSGKTRVLTSKIIHLIEDNIYKPNEIIAITFTNKAAKEMKERVYEKIKVKMQISTFHSFGLKIIRENYNELNLDKNFNILDDYDSKILVKKIIEDMNLNTKQFDYKKIKQIISNSKNEVVDANEYSKYHKGFYEEKVAKIYKKYEESLIKSSSLDFDDLLTKPLELLKNQDILNKYQYKYVLIDEYQDTNECQYQLSKLISNKYKNICVVGDESQNIYSWRGANYKNILNFENDYKDAKTILLEQNYRSTKTILNAANSLIKNNVDRKDKNLFTENEDGNKIKLMQVLNEKEEALEVINEIKKIKDVPYNEIAILYRTNAQSAILEEAFKHNNIPYQIYGGTSYYDRKEVKDLIAYLKLINNYKDDISFLRIINFPRRKLGEKFIEKLQEKAIKKNISLFEALEDISFKKMILKLMDKKKLSELVDQILKETNLIEAFDEEMESHRRENLEEFKSIVSRFEADYEDSSLANFLFEKSLIRESDEQISSKVSLMTAHSSKGLEFDVVFVIGLEEMIFPHASSMADKKELEEERRLFYVAITRARKQLYFFHTIRRNIFGRTNTSEISRFVSEIDEKCFTEESIEDLKVGEKIKHSQFGDGIIVAIKEDIVTVIFNNKIKTIFKKYLRR